jgi:hypothetical protein
VCWDRLAIGQRPSRAFVVRVEGTEPFDIFTVSTAFWVMDSIRLDLGYGSQVQA